MKKTICIVFLILICVALVIDTYSYNQMSMDESSIYKYYLWIVVLMSPFLIVFLLFNNKWFKQKSIKVYGLFVGYVFLLSLIQSNLGIIDNIQWILILHIIVPFLCLSLSYTAIKQIKIDANLIVNLSLVMWVVFVVVFCLCWTSLNNALGIDTRGMNNIYYVILSLPLCQCCRSKAIRTTTFVLTGILCVFSLKRGAMLGFGLMVFLYYLNSVKTNWLEKIFTIIVVGLFVFFAYNYLDELSGNYISSRFKMQNSGDDAREQIYTSVLDAIKKSSITEILLGHGSNSVAGITEHELSAHDDFLEILYDYGIVALFLWVVFLITVFKEAIHKIRIRNPNGQVLMASLGIVLVLCTFSHFFFMGYSDILMIGWGYLLLSDELQLYVM